MRTFLIQDSKCTLVLGYSDLFEEGLTFCYGNDIIIDMMKIKETIDISIGQKIGIYQPLGYVYKIIDIVSPNKIVADYTGNSWDRVTLTKKNGCWNINETYPVIVKWRLHPESNGQTVIL